MTRTVMVAIIFEREKQGWLKKRICFVQREGKHSSWGTQGEMWNGRGRSILGINLGGNIRGRCGVGGAIFTGVGRLGSRVRSWGLRAFTLLLLSCPQKVRIKWQLWARMQGCKENSIPRKSSLSGWRGVSLNKRARVHHSYKSEHLSLAQKVILIIDNIGLTCNIINI